MTHHYSDLKSLDETTRFYPVVIRGAKHARIPAVNPEYINVWNYPTSSHEYQLSKTYTSTIQQSIQSLAGPCYENNSLILNKSFLVNSSPLNQKIDIKNKHLADILWVWEGEDGQWEENMPLILRFDNTDVVISPKRNGQIVLWNGSVKTEYPVFLTSNKTTAGKAINKEFCLQWLTQNRLSSLIGKQISSFELLRCTTGDVVLLTFSNTSSLIIRNQNGYLGIEILQKAC